MECKARLIDLSFGIDRRPRATFQIEASPDGLAGLADKDIRLTAQIWREKRSLDANAYFHVLVGKIAQSANMGLIEAKNRLIADYGQYERTETGIMMVILRDEVDWTKLETLHLHPTSAVKVLDDGKMYRVYAVMRGSHTYDTSEMSRLIDGTVREAKELGIETLTPEELERMKASWKAS